jgi:hypothetical protein
VDLKGRSSIRFLRGGRIAGKAKHHCKTILSFISSYHYEQSVILIVGTQANDGAQLSRVLIKAEIGR